MRSKEVPKELADQKDELHSIKALGDTEGGKALVASLLADVVTAVHQLKIGGDNTACVATIKSKLALVETIMGAKAAEENVDTLIAEALSE